MLQEHAHPLDAAGNNVNVNVLALANEQREKESGFHRWLPWTSLREPVYVNQLTKNEINLAGADVLRLRCAWTPAPFARQRSGAAYSHFHAVFARCVAHGLSESGADACAAADDASVRYVGRLLTVVRLFCGCFVTELDLFWICFDLEQCTYQVSEVGERFEPCGAISY